MKWVNFIAATYDSSMAKKVYDCLEAPGDYLNVLTQTISQCANDNNQNNYASNISTLNKNVQNQ